MKEKTMIYIYKDYAPCVFGLFYQPFPLKSVTNMASATCN